MGPLVSLMSEEAAFLAGGAGPVQHKPQAIEPTGRQAQGASSEKGATGAAE
jgi:hypothetical protein